MADYPFVLAPGKISDLLESLRDRGVPQKLTNAWLSAAGFTSTNDRRFVPFLKFLGILDGTGAPTSEYHALRGHDWQRELGRIIQSAYGDLYEALPNAHGRTREQLASQIRVSVPGVNSDTVARMVNTFQAVAALADFQGAATSGQAVEVQATSPQARTASAAKPPEPQPPVAQIAIQVQLDPTMSAEQIDQVFASMAKHIYGRTVE